MSGFAHGRSSSARAMVAGCVLALAALWPAGPGFAGCPACAAATAFAHDRVLLRLRPDVAHVAWSQLAHAPPRDALRPTRPPALTSLSARLAGARIEPEFPGEHPGGDPDLTTFWIAHLDPRLSPESAVDAARTAAEVAEASPIAVVPIEDAAPRDVASAPLTTGGFAGTSLAAPAPNDSLWNLCYWLQQPSRRDLHALEAWDITRGEGSILAIIDTGVLRWHPDLGGKTPGDPGQFWSNAAEQNGLPGVDDDGNGYVDDVWGWDFVALDSSVLARPGEDFLDEDNDPSDFAVHGTAVAGVACAIAGNVSGTAGVAPGAKIMALRAGFSALYNPAGSMDMSSVARAIVYAVRNGATVINCSFSSVQQADLAAAVALATQAGVVIVVAAGNNGSPNALGNLDETITVTASDQADRITAFANRAEWVDVAAPGQSIATTTLRPTGTDSIGLRTPSYSPGEAGTSFSAPMVAGAVALLQADRRARGLAPAPPPLVQLRVMETSDDISAVNTGSGYGWGRPNLLRLLTDPPRSFVTRVGAPTVGPAVVVRDDSGVPMTVFATADSGLLYTRAASGDTLARAALGARPVGGVASALLGPGLGSGFFVALEDGRIAGCDAHGAPLPGWPVLATGTVGGEAMPALGDLDADGFTDVVWGGADGRVWAWKANGAQLTGFPRAAGPPGPNVRVALGPLDGHVGLEIVAAGNDTRLRAWNGRGIDLPGWPFDLGSTPASPSIVHLKSETAPTVIVTGGQIMWFLNPAGHNWLRRVFDLGDLTGELAIGDLDPNNSFESIVGVTSDPANLYVTDVSGYVRFTRHMTPRSGSPVIGPMMKGAGAHLLVTTVDAQDRAQVLAFTSGFTMVPGWPRPGRPGTALTLADVDGDGATEVVAGAGGDHLAFVYDAGPGTWRAPDAFWPTPRANFARTGSPIDPPPQPGDELPPLAIHDLTASVLDVRSATLRWSAPSAPGPEPRVAAYDVRIATSPLDNLNFEDATPVTQSLVPAAPGEPESLRVAGLQETKAYRVAIRSQSASGRWSPISNVVLFNTRSFDPGAVLDLRAISGADSAVTFTWTATGDDGFVGQAARYRIRAAAEPLDSAAFATATLGADVAATAAAGQPEQATLRHLPKGVRLHFALRAVDAQGNESALSNDVAALVGRLAAVNGIALLLARSPARAPVEMEWQGAGGGASATQKIAIYDLGGRLQQTIPLAGQTGGVARWDGRARDGGDAPAGIYFARFTSGSSQVLRRVVLLR